MFLLEFFSYEFRQVLQIAVWISVPLIAVSVSVTVLLHHRRKRRQKKNASSLPVKELAWQLPPLAQPLLARASKNVFIPTEQVLHWGDGPYKKDCLEDMLQAKQLQIEQLQQQLDQRIKTNWQQAHDHTNAIAQWQNNFNETCAQVKTLEEKLQSGQHEVDNWQQKISGQAEENNRLQLELTEKTDKISQLEHTLTGLQQEKEMLEENVKLISNDLKLAEEKLLAARQQAKEYEQKWEHGSHLLSRIYRELSGNIEENVASAEGAPLMEVA